MTEVQVENIFYCSYCQVAFTSTSTLDVKDCNVCLYPAMRCGWYEQFDSKRMNAIIETSKTEDVGLHVSMVETHIYSNK